MKYNTYLILIISMVIFLSSNIVFCDIDLPKDLLDIIDESVFEVVVLKPENDSLSYEKPLPLDLIPYTVRTDKYYSIGTAFAISEHEFLSVAHAFNLEFESQYRNIYIRDKEGYVYEIDEILKYSDHKDFVLFTTKGKTVNRPLKVNSNFELNSAVYAVGNAFGEGIIVRNGILTSRTPEEENGEWEWIRFSAAVSPGNSGGPLLNSNGNIIGLITRKSENENLNFALPLSVIKESKDNIAVCHKRVIYKLGNTYKVKYDVYDYETELPKNYHDLKEELTNNYNEFLVKTLDALLEENKESFFPHSKGSLNLLHDTISAFFPHLICEEENGNWSAFYPSDIRSVGLDNNGYIEYGDMAGFTFIYFEKPDYVSLKEITDNSKLFMDLILKGIPFYRNVMNEQIRITSLGEAYEKYEFIDKYKRKWLIRTWLLEHDDTKVITFSLLIPGGTITILAHSNTDLVDNGYSLDLKVLSNFIYLSYYGTFKQWDEFFQNIEYLPDIFSTVEFSYVKDKAVSFKSKRLSFSYTQDMFSISDDSDMSLYFVYFRENNKVVWDVGGIVFGEYTENSNYISISKDLKPAEGLNDSYISEWEKIMNKENPYNNKPYMYEGQTIIITVHPTYKNIQKNNEIKNDFIYTVGLNMEGKVSSQRIKKKLKEIKSALVLYE